MSAHRIHRERVNQALSLGILGYSPAEIAVEMGCTLRQAARWLSEGIASMPDQSPDDSRALSEARLEAASRKLMAELASADVNVALRAAQALATVEGAKSRLVGTWLKPLPEEDVA